MRLAQEELESTQAQADELQARIKKYLNNIAKVGHPYRLPAC